MCGSVWSTLRETVSRWQMKVLKISWETVPRSLSPFYGLRVLNSALSGQANSYFTKSVKYNYGHWYTN